MKKYIHLFVLLFALSMVACLAGCADVPVSDGSTPVTTTLPKPTDNAQNLQQINDMIAKLETAKTAAATARDEALAVLTADFEAKQADASSALAQVNAVYTARAAALAETIQTLQNINSNDTEAVTAAVTAAALMVQEDHTYGTPIEHSRTAACNTCDEKDIYQICTKCNALKWDKLSHELQMHCDMKNHWSVCVRCNNMVTPQQQHTTNAEGECSECKYILHVDILIVEKFEGESEALLNMIDDRHAVTVVSAENVPDTMDALMQYDEVILVNVRYSDMPAGFEELLHRYVQEMGGGLLTVGGENELVDGQLTPYAYNRADIARSTYYKNMLPVHVQDFGAPTAVLIVVDISASMTIDHKDEVALDAAMAIVETLGQQDYCGLMTMSNTSDVIYPIASMTQKDELIAEITGLQEASYTGQGGTIFSGAFLKAADVLADVDGVDYKQIIVITDGDPGDEYEHYASYIEENKTNGITTSVISIYQDNEERQEDMQAVADLGGGKYYNIVQEEIGMMPVYIMEQFAPEIAAPICYGKNYTLELGDASVVVEGVDPALLPGLTGCYVTQLKNGAIAPLVSGWMPIYAQWQYGKGHVASFLCDLNGNWSADFVASESAASLLDTILVILANEAEEDETTEAGA